MKHDNNVDFQPIGFLIFPSDGKKYIHTSRAKQNSGISSVERSC